MALIFSAQRRAILVFWTAAAALLICQAAGAVPGRLDDVHKPLIRVLRDYVRPVLRYDRNMAYLRSQVKYPALISSGAWNEYRRGLLRIDASRIKTASEPDRKAFWINTYNMLVIDGILAEYPLQSVDGEPNGTVKSVPDFFSRPHPVAGIEISLAGIEQKLLEFRDPRVWLAVNQGAVGSPPLPEEPYNATDLEDQLDAALRNYLADPVRFHIDHARNRMVLSELFRTRADAIRDAGLTIPPALQSYPVSQAAVVAFILPHIREQDRQYILEKRPAIEFSPFDWSLNLAL